MTVLAKLINITWKTEQLPKYWKLVVLIPFITEEGQNEKCTIQQQANITGIMYRNTDRKDD